MTEMKEGLEIGDGADTKAKPEQIKSNRRAVMVLLGGLAAALFGGPKIQQIVDNKLHPDQEPQTDKDKTNP